MMMRKSISIAVLSCILATAGYAQEDTARVIMLLEEELNSAFNRYDAEALDRLWDEKLSFITLNGTVVGKAQRLAGLRSPPANPPESANDAVDVKVYGDVAVAIVLSRWSGLTDGKRYSTNYRATHVWTRRSDGWKLVAAHVSQVKI